MHRVASVFIAVSLATSPVHAVLHINPNAYPHAFGDQLHHPSTADIKRFGSLHSAIIGTSTGAKTVAVILVQFPSASGTWTSGNPSITNANLITIDQYFSSMN